MQNTLLDLNNHLFTQLERLNEEGLKGDSLTNEIERSRALTAVSGKIIENATLALKAKEVAYEMLGTSSSLPKMLTADRE